MDCDVYLFPTGGRIGGLVNCQTAIITMTIKMTMIAILALAPMSVDLESVRLRGRTDQASTGKHKVRRRRQSTSPIDEIESLGSPVLQRQTSVWVQFKRL